MVVVGRGVVVVGRRVVVVVTWGGVVVVVVWVMTVVAVFACVVVVVAVVVVVLVAELVRALVNTVPVGTFADDSTGRSEEVCSVAGSTFDAASTGPRNTGSAMTPW
ncbi:hypothetical protein [Alloactinosynnema sp. L-07]|uniref:hypothetical protein n=1 Tax=Alloactinosynnema sp. L-07 TaxID=1653480 RepID=UPI0008350CC3|nr:hypothetical protein [Alloactinosynnema sp. L-07]